MDPPNDPIELRAWLNANLEHQYTSPSSIAPEITPQTLRITASHWSPWEPWLKRSILITLVCLRKKQLTEEMKDAMQQLIETASKDNEQWVRVIAQMLQDYPTTGFIRSHIEGEDDKFLTDVIEKTKEKMLKFADASSIPKEFAYLDRRVADELLGDSGVMEQLTKTHFLTEMTAEQITKMRRTKIQQMASNAVAEEAAFEAAAAATSRSTAASDAIFVKRRPSSGSGFVNNSQARPHPINTSVKPVVGTSVTTLRSAETPVPSARLQGNFRRESRVQMMGFEEASNILEQTEMAKQKKATEEKEAKAAKRDKQREEKEERQRKETERKEELRKEREKERDEKKAQRQAELQQVKDVKAQQAKEAREAREAKEAKALEMKMKRKQSSDLAGTSNVPSERVTPSQAMPMLDGPASQSSSTSHQYSEHMSLGPLAQREIPVNVNTSAYPLANNVGTAVQPGHNYDGTGYGVSSGHYPPDPLHGIEQRRIIPMGRRPSDQSSQGSETSYEHHYQYQQQLQLQLQLQQQQQQQYSQFPTMNTHASYPPQQASSQPHMYYQQATTMAPPGPTGPPLLPQSNEDSNRTEAPEEGAHKTDVRRREDAETMLGDTNRLAADERECVVNFLLGNLDAASLQPLFRKPTVAISEDDRKRSITLNEAVVVHNEKNYTEVTELEMDLDTLMWKKMRRRKRLVTKKKGVDP